MEILRVENLSFRYPGAPREALRKIDLAVGAGEFILLCGPSGCGKTTLLRLLKKELSPVGEKSGEIFFEGMEQKTLSEPGDIGFVRQDPESQIVTDKVWHELAFGLENMGLPQGVIRRRVGETASFFGLQGLFRQRTDTLSGGQKQLLNLASVLVMQPKLLLLDEPTGQLDPIAASEFLSTLQKLNRELGLTVLLAEHCLEEVFPMADRVLVLEDGALLAEGEPREIGPALSEIRRDHPMLRALPSAVRIQLSLGGEGVCPLTVREGRDFLERNFPDAREEEDKEKDEGKPTPSEDGEVAAEMKNVFFRYERDGEDVLRGLSLSVKSGEILCLLGGNGAGKSTALNLFAGLERAYRGKVLVGGKPVSSYRGGSLYRGNLALLPQNPQTVFVASTVRGDLAEMLQTMNFTKEEEKKRLEEISRSMGIDRLLDRHPYDLSGGEMQKCALAKALLSEPKLLLLDEPTKGLDAFAKEELRALLVSLKEKGMTAVLVTHDAAFAAEVADRCAFLFDGEILSVDSPRNFFSENSFYTTAANRMARGILRRAVTCEQVISGCRRAVEKRGKSERFSDNGGFAPQETEEREASKAYGGEGGSE